MLRVMVFLIIFPGFAAASSYRKQPIDSLRLLPFGFSFHGTFQNGYIPFNLTGPSMSQMFPEYDASRLGYDPFGGYEYVRHTSYRGVTFSLLVNPAIFNLPKLEKYLHLSLGYDFIKQRNTDQYLIYGNGISVIRTDSFFSATQLVVRDSCMYYDADIVWKGQMKSASAEICLHSADDISNRFIYGAGLFCGYYWMHDSRASIKIVQSLGSHKEFYWGTDPNWNYQTELVTKNSEVTYQEYERSIRFRFINVGISPYMQCNLVVDGYGITAMFLKTYVGIVHYFDDYGIIMLPKFRTVS